MADCLTLLRQYNIQKKEIVERDGLIIFDQMAWPRNAKTNYLVYRTGQGGSVKEYYTLESLLFLLKNVGLSHPMYVQRAGAQNVPVIKFPDRRGLLAYLNGEADTSASIDKSVHLEMGMPAPVPKRPLEEAQAEAVKKPRLSEELLAEKQRLKEKMERKDKGGGAITDQIKSGLGDTLRNTLSIEQIAAIKAKRFAKKRGTIKADDDITGGSFMDDTTKDIVSKERVHRTRVTVLQSSGKSFSNIFSLLQSVKARDEGKVSATEQVPQEEPKPARNPPAPTHGYSRYDQERFKGQEETGDFKIDTTGTYRGMTINSLTEDVPKPRSQAPVVAKQPQTIARNTVTNEKSPGKPNRKDHRMRTPIIVVPAAATSVITVWNVKEFLEDYKFISSDDKKKSGAKRATEVVIHRRKPHPHNVGQTISIPYRVTDNPLRLSPSEWKQIVCVFVAGPTWQFKGWPGLTSDGSPVDIFTKVKGYHVKFDELRLDPNISKWDVHVLQISKTRRHLDKASVLRFWETLDKFIVKQHPDLRY